MAAYAIWNNKGGVGKSYLTFQLAAEYALQNATKKVLVIDLCPQANSSSMLLGGMFEGEKRLNEIHSNQPRNTISGYIDDRILSPYVSPNSGANYLTKVSEYNDNITDNLYLVVGDELLELQSSKVYGATNPGPQDAWRIVHIWIRDLITDIKNSWNQEEICIFIDCNPSFTIYTELALTAAERLLIPFSADGSSQRAVMAVLSLIYGARRHQGEPQSDFYLNSNRYRMSLPRIYMYIGNRLTQMNSSSASAFKTIVNEIGEEIWKVWQSNPTSFCLHPNGAVTPKNQHFFKRMFQHEINDANTASVVSGALGIPISRLTAGQKIVAGKKITVNQSQLDKQVPNIQKIVNSLE
jgi:cellulose biosynthesis protein BcsQ